MTGDDRRQEQARRGLEAWAGFPADHEPRPLVLLGPAARPGGFPDGQTKMAFLRGAVQAAPGFPDAVLQVMRREPTEYAGPPLRLTKATLGTAEFATDRERQVLPAWRVRAKHVPEPIWVLDPAIVQLTWQPPGLEPVSWQGTAATLDPDGCTLHMTFYGSPHVNYPDVEVLESGAAVALLPVPSPLRPGWYTALGQRREVTVTLDRALGPRILLDERGSPVMVTTGRPGADRVKAAVYRDTPNRTATADGHRIASRPRRGGPADRSQA